MNHAATALPGPLLLEGRLQPTLWGGRNLAHIAGKSLPEHATIGESWETAVESVVRNAPFEGIALGALVDQYGERLLGTRAVEVFGHRFPLLTKFLDAQQSLSVQVHPDDEYAATYEHGSLGKTEAWYILHADPGARLVYGVSRDTSRDEVARAIAETSLEDLLHTFEAHPGDIVYVPAGTVHAICSGIILYEIQEYSDVTYRLYDYGRLQPDGTPRDLHVEKGLDVMQYTRLEADRVTPVTVESGDGCGSRRILVACRYFVLEELDVRGEFAAEADGTTCHILTVVSGTCRLRSAHGVLALALGETAVVPASVTAYTLLAEEARVLRSYVPLAHDANLKVWRAHQSRSTVE